MLRSFVLFFTGLLLLAATPAHAQQADGYWLGVLNVSPSMALRIGVAVEHGDAGTATGVADSPDQRVFDIPLTELTATPELLAFAIPAVGGRYEGRWNAAVSAYEGTFFQAGQAWPLVLRTANRPERTAPAPLASRETLPDDPAMQAILERRIAGRAGEGIVVGVIGDGREPRFVAVGPAGAQSFTPDTMFELGSLTKIFTALLLADMVQAGEVALDDPVERYLPDGATMPTRGGKQITLRMLTMQNSGLPRLPGNMPYANPADPYADYTEAHLLAFLNGYQLPRDPGGQYEYSNLGVGLLGYALGRAGGRDYASLLRERILEPLGLTDTAITLSPQQAARFATGHDEYMRPAPPWNLGALVGAGALRSSARDILRFLAAALDPTAPIAPEMQLLLSDRLGTAGGPQTALGWLIVPPPSGEVLHHGGGTGGFRTHMALQPATGRAVVVLTNAAVEPSAQDIAMHLIAGLPLATESPVPSPPAAAPTRTEVTLNEGQLAHAVGEYRLAPGVMLTVRRAEAGLTAQITGQPAFPIYPSAPLEFFWRVVDARVRLVEEGGAVTGGVLLQNGAEIPLTKVG